MPSSSTPQNATHVSRLSERALQVTRQFNARPEDVFKAWTTPALLKRWWPPKSMGMTLEGCEVDARTGGSYRFQFAHNGEPTMAFFGRYVEVIPGAKIVWTNEESSDGALSTATFSASEGKTNFTLTETYPNKQALDQSFDGMEACMPEQFTQLDAVLAETVR